MNWQRACEIGRIALLFAFLMPSPAARAELPAEVTALLERSIAAHRSGPARLRVVYRGVIASPDQSATPEGPFRGNTWTIRIAIDESAGSLAFDPDLAIDGDFSFRNRIGFSNGSGFVLSYTGESRDELTAFPPVADAYLPHRLLQTVLATAQTGSVAADATRERLSYQTATGERRVLLFDRRTHLLAAVQRPPAPTVYGDQTRETVYERYRRIDGTMVPGIVNLRLTNPIHGTIDRKLHLVEWALGGPSTAELTPPAGAVRRAPDPRPLETIRLGRDAYLLRNVATDGPLSYNVLAVVFEDDVLIVEAALDDATSRRVIATVAGLAPDKPITRLVQTHHHGDHIGGIRTYIANGVTIVAPLGMRSLIERIATTHSVLAPDSLARSPRPARVEEVQGERTIRDTGNELRLYDLPSAHSAHMLVVYLPEQQVLYQGDLINAGEIPLNATSRRFLAWLREHRLPVTAAAGVHGRTLTGAELEALLHEEGVADPNNSRLGE
jgi:glyoxylase-like metal-dependent hydrolase (beta-lactamase superfamily II)